MEFRAGCQDGSYACALRVDGEAGVWQALCFKLREIDEITCVVYVDTHEFSFTIQIHEDTRHHLTGIGAGRIHEFNVERIGRAYRCLDNNEISLYLLSKISIRKRVMNVLYHKENYFFRVRCQGVAVPQAMYCLMRDWYGMLIALAFSLTRSMRYSGMRMEIARVVGFRFGKLTGTRSLGS